MKKLSIHLAVAVLALASCCKNDTKSPILTVEGGQIQGVRADLSGVYVYRGIPYAAAPIGDLRWKEPQPVVPWQGVKLCDRFGHPGYQSVHYPGGYTTEWGYGAESNSSEDCLYLNVWTPAPAKKDAKLPVALWIHGGGYREGWGSEPEFDAQEWAAKGVVLVSINYRLGVFGFLTHPLLSAESEHGVSGNYGILDQIQSLKWIQANIEQFGGDPDNVMIFGQSAGAGSVKTLCASPLTKGLFHKAIIMSGGGIAVGDPSKSDPARALNNNYLEAAEQKCKTVLDWAGLDDLKKMRAASTETIYALNDIYVRANKLPGGMWRNSFLTGSPVVDGYVSDKIFDDAATSGTIADVPYIIGFTLHDLGQMGDAIYAFCLDREKYGKGIWAYEFARPLPDDGSHPEVTARLKGAFHSSDLWFVFKSLQHCWRPWTKGDWDLSEKMLTAWTNFAKYSNPNGPSGESQPWQQTTASNPDFMIFALDGNDAEASHMGPTFYDSSIPSSRMPE